MYLKKEKNMLKHKNHGSQTSGLKEKLDLYFKIVRLFQLVTLICV